MEFDKKKSLVIQISLLLILAFFSCAHNSSHSNEDRIITLQASDEAIEQSNYWASQKNSSAVKSMSIVDLRASYLSSDRTSLSTENTDSTLKEETFSGSKVYTLSNGNYNRIVLYLHGGSFVHGIFSTHLSFCDDLSNMLNAKVYLPQYPLAPEHTYKDTLSTVSSLYKELLKQGKPIYVMGDSAGGTITLSLIHMLKEDGEKLPNKIVLISPWVDLSLSNEGIPEYEKKDPVLFASKNRYCALMWAGDKDLKDPLISPLYDDLSQYPEALLFVASNDILCLDNMLFYGKMTLTGNKVTLVKGEGLYHMFPLFNIPERQQSLEIIEDFIK